jgi:hypothetical protein
VGRPAGRASHRTARSSARLRVARPAGAQKRRWAASALLVRAGGAEAQRSLRPTRVQPRLGGIAAGIGDQCVRVAQWLLVSSYRPATWRSSRPGRRRRAPRTMRRPRSSLVRRSRHGSPRADGRRRARGPAASRTATSSDTSSSSADVIAVAARRSRSICPAAAGATRPDSTGFVDMDDAGLSHGRPNDEQHAVLRLARLVDATLDLSQPVKELCGGHARRRVRPRAGFLTTHSVMNAR